MQKTAIEEMNSLIKGNSIVKDILRNSNIILEKEDIAIGIKKLKDIQILDKDFKINV